MSNESDNERNSFPETVDQSIIRIICGKFMDHLPLEYRDDYMRILFELELGHWFYVDHFVGNPSFPECKPVGFKDFCKLVYRQCDYLKPKIAECSKMVEMFKKQKQYIPTNGAILIDESLEYVLLVQGYFASSNSWGFPKGKVNEGELSLDCAIREVYEETGYDIKDKINTKRSFSRYTNKALTQLFVVPGIEMDFDFKPHLNKEIKKIQWFRIEYLPTDRMDFDTPARIGMKPNNFYNVVPFTNDIINFVNKEKVKRERKMQKMVYSPHPLHHTRSSPALTKQTFTGETFLNMITSSATLKKATPGASVNEPFVLKYNAPKDGVNSFRLNTDNESSVRDIEKTSDAEEWLIRKREEATLAMLKLLNISPKRD